MKTNRIQFMATLFAMTALLVGCITVKQAQQAAPIVHSLISTEIGIELDEDDDGDVLKIVQQVEVALTAARDNGVTNPQAVEAVVTPVIDKLEEEEALDHRTALRVKNYPLAIYASYYHQIEGLQNTQGSIILLEAAINGLREAQGLDPIPTIVEEPVDTTIVRPTSILNPV